MVILIHSYSFDRDSPQMTIMRSARPGGVEHYLMMNEKYRRAVWMNGGLECSIIGEVSEQEIKRITDSIRE